MPMTTIWAWSPPLPKSTAKPVSTKSPACSPAANPKLPWTTPEKSYPILGLRSRWRELAPQATEGG